MHLRHYFFLAFILLSGRNYFSQAKAVAQDPFLAKLEKTYGKKLPSSFFLIQGNTLLELYTNAPALIRRFREIQNYQLCPNVIVIFKDPAGIGPDNFPKYLKDNYYIDTSAYVKAIVSDELYKMLGEVPNSEVYYYKDGKRLKKWDGKYDRLPNTPLPYSMLEVKKEKDLVWNKYKNYYHTNVSVYHSINDSLAVELYDGQEDRIRLTNIFTGKVKKILPLYQNINYIDIYMKDFGNALQLSKEEMQKNDTFFRDIKRTPLRVGNSYVKSANEIYIAADVDIYHKAKQDFYIPGEYNTKSIFVKKRRAYQFQFRHHHQNRYLVQDSRYSIAANL